MNVKSFVGASGLLFALLCVAEGCSTTTQLTTSWKEPSAGPLNFKKVVVVVLNSTPGQRRAQEDELVAQIKKTSAVASYTLVTDEELKDHEKVKTKIRQGGFDGAIVVRLLDSTKETTYVPGSRSYWHDGSSYALYQPDYTVTDTTIQAEVSLYTVPEGKLLWVGNSSTVNPATARDLAMQVAQAAAVELRNQGLIP